MGENSEIKSKNYLSLFGNGYISWAVKNYGGYSYANAVEFSEMMAKKLGWSNYGDKEYVPHVLRYYPYGNGFGGIGNRFIVEIALSQVEMWEVSLIGHGMDLEVVLNGVLVLLVGVQMNVVILMQELFQGFQLAQLVKHGSRKEDNGKVAVMSRNLVILSFLIGKVMAKPTM